MQNPPHSVNSASKQNSPDIGAGDKLSSSYDLVEQMHFLYVQVVQAKDLPGNDVTGSCDPYVDIKLGNYNGATKHFEKNNNPEWNQVFAFSKEKIQASVLEVFVKDKNVVVDDLIGRVMFDVNEIPKRVPPDSPLAPQWYRLEDRNANKAKGEVMLAVWMGTQADEAFPDAWHSDAASVGPDGVANIRSKVYLTPNLWYMRVNVIQAQELVLGDKSRLPEVYVKAVVGHQTSRTRVSPSKTINPIWNEDLMFVVAEPFDEPLVLSVEDRVGSSKDETLGSCVIPLQFVDRRLDHSTPVRTSWYRINKHVIMDGETKEIRLSSHLQLGIVIEAGYHVFDEHKPYISDNRPAEKQLWRPSIGILELGILSAHGLVPMKAKDGRGTTDAFCVAKYGQKWVRTRTIVDNLMPRWNEQYTWEVYDPFTVITIGVFDNGHIHGGAGGVKHARFGKVRIRLSTLEFDRVCTHSYPLMRISYSGVKKTGEIQLAMRFTCTNYINMMHMYSHQLLPEMHYTHPLAVRRVDYWHQYIEPITHNQLEMFRYQAMQILSVRLCLAKPPLRKEVVEYMLDVDSYMWSMRKSKASFSRIMGVLSELIAVGKWFDQIRNWRNPITTIFIHILFFIFVVYLELILPTVFLSLFLIGIGSYHWQPMHPPHMDALLAEATHPDELDEEYDTFPTSRHFDIVRMRYDRLRCIAGRFQTMAGDLATEGERLQALVSWRDRRATMLFMIICLFAAVVLYFTPFRVVILLAGLYVLRHPRLRRKLPPFPLNFFRRLPTRLDHIF